MVRTLLQRSQSLISEVDDRKHEDQHVERVLRSRGYPDWTFKKVEGQMVSAKEKKQNKKQQQSDPGDQPQVVKPYVEKVSETIARVLRKYQFPAAIRPFSTLKRMWVHQRINKRRKKKLNVCTKFLVVIVTRHMLVRQEESLGLDSKNIEMKWRQKAGKLSPEVNTQQV